MGNKDIEMLKSLLIHAENVLIDDEALALEKLLQAYKQDEKVIEEMASYIFENIDTAKICGMINSDDCFKHSENCNSCIIEYFRKKCE